MINPGSLDAFIINMGYFLVTLGVLRLVILYLNFSTSIKFGNLLREKITTDPMSAALYFSARWIGLCIVAAAFL